MDDLTQVLDFQSAPMVALTSFALTHALEFVKQSQRIPWISQTTTRLNRFIVLAYSFFMALGIEFVWSGYTPAAGGGFIVHLPPLTAVVHGFWAWWTAEMNYRGFVKKPAESVTVVEVAPASGPLAPNP